MPLDEFRAQRRGGKGAKGAPTRDEDAVMKLVVCDTHDNLLFFTDKGKVYHLRAYDIPDTKKQAKGLPVQNLIEVDTGERVTTILVIKDYARDFILLATRLGVIKKTTLAEFAEVRRNGKIAMRLDDGDSLIAARVATDDTNVLLVSSEGQAIRFKIDDLRDASRTSGGVRGMKLPKGGYVVGVETLDDGDQLLIISETGSGKRTRVNEYPVQGRGGQGVKTLNITDRTGKVAACRMVTDSDSLELMLVTLQGIVVRTRIKQISLIGRNTQGVRVMDVNAGDQVASIAAFTMADEPERAPRDAAMEAMNGTGGTNGVAATGTTRGVAPNSNLRLALDLDEETGEILEDDDDEAEDNDTDE
jgi:DNA gyrase subunit A